MELTKFSHACVRLDDGDRVLTIDPGAFSEVDAALDGAGAVLVTHEHADHIDAEKVTAALDADSRLRLYAPASVTAALGDRGGQVVTAEAGTSFEAAGFSVRTFGGQHALIHPAIPVVANVAYLIDDAIYHPGDSFTVPDVAVATLLVPTIAPWSKAAEVIDFTIAVRAPQAFQIHDAIATETYANLVEGQLQRIAGPYGVTFTHLATLQTVAVGRGVGMSLDAARALLAEHPIIDGHNDLPWAMRGLNGYDIDAYRLDERQTSTRTDLVRLREGGVGGQFWSVYVPAGLAGTGAVTATLEQIDFVLHMVARHPDRLALALTASDVERAFADGKIASLMGAEGGHSIDSSLAVLRVLHALGVRYMTLTHNDNVPWADSATDVEVLGGLNDFGRDVVREMNALGMLVDLSHVSAGTMRDALDTSTAPVVFSHSSARAVTDHVRNVPDDVLTRLAGNGGVCMVTFVPAFVSREFTEWDAAVLARMAERGEDRRDWTAHMAAVAEYEKTHPAPVATVAQVADHVEHVRSVAGVQHVGLGGDFDGCDPMPAGLDDVTGYPALIAELLDRGWSDGDLAALTRGNVLRVLHDAESTSG